MKTTTWLAILASLMLGAAARAGVPPIVVTNMSGVASVEAVRADDDGVHATVVNQTDQPLQNVRLLVADTFYWRNALHPGPDDPGRVTEVEIPGPIPPHASVPVSVARTLPERRDGAFVTSVDVVQATMASVPPARSSSAAGVE